MDNSSALTVAELRFLAELNAGGVSYLVVGLSAALLQGANTATQDVDLWFESTADSRIGAAARAAGGIWVPGGWAGRGPQLGGDLGDRFDVVVMMSGLDAFAIEYARSRTVAIDGVSVRVLPLDRILASKRAANRLKDQAVIPALEEALAASEDQEPTP